MDDLDEENEMFGVELPSLEEENYDDEEDDEDFEVVQMATETTVSATAAQPGFDLESTMMNSLGNSLKAAQSLN